MTGREVVILTDTDTTPRINWYICLIGILVCISYSHFFVNRAYVELDVTVQKKTYFKIYWAKNGEPFSEKRHARILVNPNQNNYSFFLADLKEIDELRIDPQEYLGESTISSITFKQKGIRDISLNTGADFAQLKSLSQIESSNFQDGRLTIRSSGKDPAFQLTIKPELYAYDWGEEVTRWIVLFLGTCIVGMLVGPVLFEYRFISLFLTAALALTVVMAGISLRDSHPDEHVHIEASRYYKDHWLPPHVDDKNIGQTYSCYGVSRLNNLEAYYFFAGKFGALFSASRIDDYKLFRAFNVFMLLCILLISFSSLEARLVALPFLISPQIWYLFSYCNSDAFGLFITFLAGWQIVGKKTLFKNYLFSENNLKLVGSVLLLGSLLCAILMLKKNFYPFLLFIAGTLAVYCWKIKKEHPVKPIIIRLAAILVIGGTLLGMRVGLDYWVNGFDRSEKIAAMRVELAEPPFNPLTKIDKQHAYLVMKTRGVTLEKIIDVHRWCEKTFRSAVGVYGYTSISAQDHVYNFMRWTLVGILLFFTANVMIQGDLSLRCLYLFAFFLSSALIAASLWHSWSVDFQPQGRYLFPIIPIMGIIVALSAEVLRRNILFVLILFVFLQSCYSFIFLGIMRIPRLSVFM